MGDQAERRCLRRRRDCPSSSAAQAVPQADHGDWQRLRNWICWRGRPRAVVLKSARCSDLTAGASGPAVVVVATGIAEGSTLATMALTDREGAWVVAVAAKVWWRQPMARATCSTRSFSIGTWYATADVVADALERYGLRAPRRVHCERHRRVRTRLPWPPWRKRSWWRRAGYLRLRASLTRQGGWPEICGYPPAWPSVWSSLWILRLGRRFSCGLPFRACRWVLPPFVCQPWLSVWIVRCGRRAGSAPGRGLRARSSLRAQ